MQCGDLDRRGSRIVFTEVDPNQQGINPSPCKPTHPVTDSAKYDECKEHRENRVLRTPVELFLAGKPMGSGTLHLLDKSRRHHSNETAIQTFGNATVFLVVARWWCRMVDNAGERGRTVHGRAFRHLSDRRSLLPGNVARETKKPVGLTGFCSLGSEAVFCLSQFSSLDFQAAISFLLGGQFWAFHDKPSGAASGSCAVLPRKSSRGR